MNMKKRNNKKFRLIGYPIAGFLAALLVTSTVLLDVYSQSLDWFFGRGDVVIQNNGQKLDSNYYNAKYDGSVNGKLAAQANGQKVTEEICDQGQVLLKNDGVLPLSKGSKVTEFGYRSVKPIYGGVGSGAIVVGDYFHTLDKAMDEYFSVNPKMKSTLSKSKARFLTDKGYESNDGMGGDFDGGTVYIGEFNPNVYKSEDVGDYKTGIVFVGREAGEGNDLQDHAYSDGTEHQLKLSTDEKAMIKFAKDNCEKVIVIVNTSNALELGELQDDKDINAILWIGQPGSAGFRSMAKILTGEVNPSGKTVDIYARDAKSHPSTKNSGDHTYSNGDNIKYVEYEEGIYVGYRYFETAAYTGDIDYDSTVLYPFGYGLNYDDDKVTQELTSVQYQNGQVTVKGKISNQSANYDVNEVVQVYYNPVFNKESGIEKSAKNLIAFDKVNVKKNSSEEFTLTFKDEDMASYDYKGYYTSNGAYVLEKGDYEISLGKDSHNVWGKDSITVDENKVYTDDKVNHSVKAVGKRTSDTVVAKNLYPESNEYMANSDCVNLTRTDFKGTYPTTSDNKVMPDKNLENFQACKDQTLSYKDKLEERFGKEAPKSEAKNGLQLSEFRGLDYNDPLWDSLLDQLIYTGNGSSQLKSLIGKAAYSSGALDCIGKPATTDVDGPQGLSKVSPVNAYMAEAILGATWNKELSKKFGQAIGEEFLAHTRVGWYGPAMNIHRSPFAGRNYEYYSEDPLLSGIMARETVSAAGEKGVVSYIKHFAVNDQEKNRQKITTWANEQAMREIYFKPFEICVKQAECEIKYNARLDNGSFEFKSKKIKATLGVMSSMNAIGSTFACYNYSLMQEMLRDEWGFDGSIITDSLNTSYSIDLSVQAGTSLWLWYERNNFSDMTSPYMQNAIRDAVHHIGYSYANSLIMQGVAPSASIRYRTSPWRYVETLCEVILLLGILVVPVWDVIRIFDKRKHPDKYVSSKKEKAE